MNQFFERLQQRMLSSGSSLCVGLDIRANTSRELEKTIREVVDQTFRFAAAYKPNSAYFERLGADGFDILESLRGIIPSDIPMILDVKRGDIGETQKMYAEAAYGRFRADAVTLNPYMGPDSIEPFLREDKGVYLLGLTSNPGSEFIQKLRTSPDDYVYDHSVRMAHAHGCGIVMGLPTMSARDVELIPPHMPMLIPGLGAQAGEADHLQWFAKQEVLPLVNVSRGILSDPEITYEAKARRWRDIIHAQLHPELR